MSKQPAISLSKPFMLTGVHDRILKNAIAPYHLLTAKQITRLLHPTAKLGNLTTMQNRLKQLADAKYLTAVHLPTAEGVRPYVYCLGLHGRKYLKDEGLEVETYFEKTDLQTRSYGWFMHLLELNDFLIFSRTLEISLPQVVLHEWLHDFTIAKKPPAGVKKDGKLCQVNPDGWLYFRHFLTIAEEQKTRHYRFLVELDRGTESEAKITRKIHDYLVLYDNGNLHTFLNLDPKIKFIYVLFPTTAGAKRVGYLREVARETLKAYDKTISAGTQRNQMFKFAAVPALMQQPLDSKALFCDPLWLSPFDPPEELGKKYSLIELN